MYEGITEEQKSKARIMKALGHPARVFIVELISKDKICVCSIARMLGLSFAATSKHFTILKNAGIVDEQKEKNNVYYRLVSPCVIEFMKVAKKTVFCLRR